MQKEKKQAGPTKEVKEAGRKKKVSNGPKKKGSTSLRVQKEKARECAGHATRKGTRAGSVRKKEKKETKEKGKAKEKVKEKEKGSQSCATIADTRDIKQPRVQIQEKEKAKGRMDRKVVKAGE